MSLQKEARALEALTRLLKAVDECRALFDEAGMEYPAPLQRLLGKGTMDDARHEPRARIDPPKSPHRPPGVPSEWVYVPLAGMTAQTLVLGILREIGGVLTMREILSAMNAKGIHVNTGSVANIGTRLERSKLIRRSPNGWELLSGANAPVLNGSYAWGSRELFTVQELAARRREIVLYLLRHYPSGLQNQQILECLEEFTWLETPLSKDLIKKDMEELNEAGKVKRVGGGSRKWTISEERV